MQRAICAKYNVYFQNEKIDEIEKQSRVNPDEEPAIINWKTLVKLALDEVYGENIMHYCAEGKRSNAAHPGIDTNVYKAIRGTFKV